MDLLNHEQSPLGPSVLRTIYTFNKTSPSHSLKPLQSQSLTTTVQDAFLSIPRRCHPDSCSKHCRSPRSWSLEQHNSPFDHPDRHLLQNVYPDPDQVHARQHNLHSYPKILGHSHRLPRQLHHLLRARSPANCCSRHVLHRERT